MYNKIKSPVHKQENLYKCVPDRSTRVALSFFISSVLITPFRNENGGKSMQGNEKLEIFLDLS